MCVVPRLWCDVCGASYVVRCVWCLVCGVMCVVPRMWCDVCGASYVVRCVWCMLCGDWITKAPMIKLTCPTYYDIIDYNI